MKFYVNVNAPFDGNGTAECPFRKIGEAAKIAQPGDEVLVAPGIYREYVDPVGAVITGAEEVKSWMQYKGNTWVCRVPNSTFGTYNPYTTYVYGDWYFAKAD